MQDGQFTHHGGLFATTRWTLVLAASAPGAPQALDELCRAYWYPLYAYVRRHGRGREDAEDLTQAFFAQFLKARSLDAVDASRGKFRAFLLASLKNFLANDYDRRSRLKRGGHATHLPLDWQEADARFQIADASQVPPDLAFDREWALTLLERVLAILREESAATGQGARFDHLKAYLTVDSGDIPYAEAAASLGLDAGTVRVIVHRLRKRYRDLLRVEVLHTLADPTLVDEELRTLLGAFS